MHPQLPAWLHRLAPLGLVAWLAVVLARAPGGLDEAGLAELIVLFVPLVALPTALPLAVPTDRFPGPGRERLVAALAGGWALGGLLLAFGIAAFDAGGPAAAALMIPWALFAACVGLIAAARALWHSRSAPELVIDVALVMVPGGAVWLAVYRMDLVLGGFGGLATVLTAGHFHTAGFGALIVAGLVGRAVAGAPRARRVHAVVAAALVLAYAAMAAGIATGEHAFELAGASLYAFALPAIAGLQMFAGVRVADRPARALLVLSSLCLLVSTVYALRFAAEGFYGAAVPIMTMLRMHGLVNAVGFVGLGVWGWRRAALAVRGG